MKCIKKIKLHNFNRFKTFTVEFDEKLNPRPSGFEILADKQCKKIRPNPRCPASVSSAFQIASELEQQGLKKSMSKNKKQQSCI